MHTLEGISEPAKKNDASSSLNETTSGLPVNIAGRSMIKHTMIMYGIRRGEKLFGFLYVFLADEWNLECST